MRITTGQTSACMYNVREGEGEMGRDLEMRFYERGRILVYHLRACHPLGHRPGQSGGRWQLSVQRALDELVRLARPGKE